jgi:hypothetical protein
MLWCFPPVDFSSPEMVRFITNGKGGPMKTLFAITTMSQGEKVKAGLIWISQGLALLQGLGVTERAGGLQVIQAFCTMVGHEVALARSVTGDEAWEEVSLLIERALVMMDSGVPEEAVGHLSMALSRTTSILQRSMEFLMAQGLL